MTDTYAIVHVPSDFVEVEGAKTLKMMIYGGLPYAVGKDMPVDEPVVIFLPDSQLSEEYCQEHDLIGYTDENGNKKGGFFGKNRKVRPIKLMKGKIRSVGLVMPVDSLAFTGYDVSQLSEGDSFNELNGVPICNKFINPNTQKMGTQAKAGTIKKREEVGLPMHPDTQQFYKFVDTLEKGDLITITLKLDGTSVRVANAYAERQPHWYEVWLHRAGLCVPEKIHFEILTGTRRVIIGRTEGDGFYGDGHAIYTEVGNKLASKVLPGEAIYGEIVGWLTPETPLFNRGGVIFKYGCTPGERDFYVYNIKWTLPSGTDVDLPWNLIKQRCQELGLKHVPEMSLNWNHMIAEAKGADRVLMLRDFMNYQPQFIYSGDKQELEDWVYSFVEGPDPIDPSHIREGPDPIDPSHIREGVVLRVEKRDGTRTMFYKAKSETFYGLEDQAKNEGQVDIEEQQDV